MEDGSVNTAGNEIRTEEPEKTSPVFTRDLRISHGDDEIPQAILALTHSIKAAPLKIGSKKTYHPTYSE